MNDNVRESADIDENNSSIIESEAVPDSEPVQSANQKGSFLTFINFVIAFCALAGSAYVYFQLNNFASHKQTDSPDEWKLPIQQLKEQTDKKFENLSTQITQITETNASLQKQLKTIENIAESIKTAKSGISEEDAALLQYDDTFVIQQLDSIRDDFKSRDETIKILKTELEQLNRQISEFRNADTSITNNPARIENQGDDMFMALIQAAGLQLSVNANINKSLGLLKEAQSYAVKSELYSVLASEIDSAITAVENIDVPDLTDMLSRLNSLEHKSSLLFADSTEESNDNMKNKSSWFDNLVVIRKLDSKSGKSNKEQIKNLSEELRENFAISKRALISLSQSEWEEGLERNIQMLSQKFPEESVEILGQLNELKQTTLQPELPDLKPLLNKAKEIESSGLNTVLNNNGKEE